MRFIIDVVKSLIIGIIVGVFVSLYQYLVHEIIDLSYYFINLNYLITIIASLFICLGIIVLNNKIKGYLGSGIPQVEGYQKGWYYFNPYVMLGLIILNSFFAFFTGFLVGSEGPSISIGASVGMTVNELFNEKDQDKGLTACGGSAGFAVAFSSPLAGFFHLIEENRYLINKRLLFKGSIVILVAFIVSYYLYPHNLLPFYEIDNFYYPYYIALILFILFAVILSELYIFLIIKFKDLTKDKKIMIYMTFILVVIFLLIRKYYPILVGNGMIALEKNVLDYSLISVLFILIFRLIFTSISVSSNVSGGVVLPMLAIGALGSNLLIKVLANYDSNILNYSYIFIVCSMWVVFAVVTKAPITAFILGLKCATIEYIIIPLLVSIVIGYLFVVVFKLDNIYHKLEKRLPGFIKNLFEKK